MFPNYKTTLPADGPSKKVQGLTDEQHQKLGDFVVWDAKTNSPEGPHPRHGRRDARQNGIDPALDWQGKIKLADGSEVEVATSWNLYQVHLKDYDLDTVSEITSAPKDLIEQLAKDIATIKPTSIHQGEGINHWFHATEANRAAYLPLMLTGNIGKPGRRLSRLGGQLQSGAVPGQQARPGRVSKAGLRKIRSSRISIRKRTAKTSTRTPTPRTKSRPIGTTATAPLIVEHAEGRPQEFYRQDAHAHADQGDLHDQREPDQQRQVGLRHDQERQPERGIDRDDGHADDRVGRVFRLRAAGQFVGRIRRIWKSPPAARIRFCKSGKAASSRSTTPKMISTILAGIADALGKVTGDKRFHDHFKFEHDGKREHLYPAAARHLHHHRRLQARRHHGRQIRPAGRRADAVPHAIRAFRSTSRSTTAIRSTPTPAGCIPTATTRRDLVCGENFIVHREGPEATPYLPNVIVSSNPLVRPERLRHSARRRALGRAHRAQRQDAVGRREEDQELPLGKGISVLLPHAQVAPQRPLVAGRTWTGT